MQKKNSSFVSSDEKEAIQKAVEPKIGVPSVDSSTYKPLVSAQPLTPQWTPSYFAVRFNICRFILNKFINARHDYKRQLKLQGHYVTMDNQMYPVSQTVNRAIPAALDPAMNMLLSETRIANAEIRMGMSKISDNVQKLLDKVCISIRG